MLEKLQILYEKVEPAGPDTFIVGAGGKLGLMQKGRLALPVKYQQIRIFDDLIVASVSDGFRYGSVFSREMRRLLPPPESPKEMAELHSVTPWEGFGLFLLLKEPPTHASPMLLALLANDGEIKKYTGVNRLPLLVEQHGLAAVVRPGEKPHTTGFSISLEQCIEECEAGTLLEVVDKTLRVYDAGDLCRLRDAAP